MRDDTLPYDVCVEDLKPGQMVLVNGGWWKFKKMKKKANDYLTLTLVHGSDALTTVVMYRRIGKKVQVMNEWRGSSAITN